MPDLEPIERRGLAAAMAGLPNFEGGLHEETAARLANEDVPMTTTNGALAIRLVAAARGAGGA